MTLDQIRQAVESDRTFKNSTARRVVGILKQEGVNRESIDYFSGSDWYEFVKAASEDLAD